MKTNDEIDKYLEKNVGSKYCDEYGNRTYFDDYTGKVKYIVDYNNIINKYSRDDDNKGLFGISNDENKKLKFEFECERATFGITEDGFIDWKIGIFLTGDFIGDFKGVWKSGNFHYGNFVHSVWENGVWNGNLFEHSIWKNGTWLTKDKVFNSNKKSIFIDSIWENGTWTQGGFINSTWLNGTWKRGNFVDSQWINGIWESGSFVNSTWVDGNWYGGELNENSAWLAGPFNFRDEVRKVGEGKYIIKNKPNKFNYEFARKKIK